MTQRGALENLVVLDLTRVVAGPFCGSILGDMGARVIKIETPKSGDDSRAYGPHVNGESAYFAMLNRSKEGITLNLKDPEGKRIFLELVKKADIVIENYRPGVMDKLGLGYDTLKEVNDQIIYGAVSGYGSYGPYSQRPGYDIVAQAMGGLMSMTGPRGSDPTRTGTALGDVLGGMNLAIGILAAVNARQVIGHGQRVDIALVDSIVACLENCVTRYRYSGNVPPRNGNTNAAVAPSDTFRGKDGMVVIACGNQKLFENLCLKVANHPEWLNDERFASNADRMAHLDELKETIEEWSSQHPVSEIVDLLVAAGVPGGPVYDLSQVVKDEHIAGARNMFPVVKHPVIGEMHVNGAAVKMMDTMPHVTRPAPLLGQDNADVYGELLGLTPEDLAGYKERGII